MGVEAHLNELNEKHRNLDLAIETEMSRPHADDLKVQELKREKLKLKDTIERVQLGTIN